MRFGDEMEKRWCRGSASAAQSLALEPTLATVLVQNFSIRHLKLNSQDPVLTADQRTSLAEERLPKVFAISYYDVFRL